MSDWIDQLERLTRLHQTGMLTDAEFEAEKARLMARQPGQSKLSGQGKSRLSLLAGGGLIAAAIAGAVWVGSGTVPQREAARPAAAPAAVPAATALATDASSTGQVPVALDGALEFSLPQQCRAGETLERVYKKLEAGMNLGSGQGLTISLEGFAEPLEITARSRKDQYQAEVADAEVRMPEETIWHGLKVSRITASRYYPPSSDGSDTRTINFLEPVDKVRGTLARLGFNAPLAPEFRLMEKPGSCDGSMQIQPRPGGAALVCNWGC